MKKFKFLALSVACAMVFAACGSNETETDDATIIEEEFFDVDETEEDLAVEDTDEINESSTSSNDYDAMLNEYERCVDNYAKILKKANSGDTDAAMELASEGQKLTDVSEKLSSVATELSQAQLTRYQNISMKLSKVSM